MAVRFDHSDTDVETRAEFDARFAEGTLAGLTVQGLDFRTDPPDFAAVDVADAMFIGCRFTGADVAAGLVARRAHVIPTFGETPYPTQPGHLYTPRELSAGFAEHGFAGMYDTLVYNHYVERGAAMPETREALAQRLHDSGIDNALLDLMKGWAHLGGGPVIGIMGGHAELRGTSEYRKVARLGRKLARSGALVVTGGGPGAMEAANLGAFAADADEADLARAIDILAKHPDFGDHDPFTAAALDVRRDLGETAADTVNGRDWARQGGLSVPTWLYGHEPANLFAAQIAKYFSNAIREDTILRLARGGIVFAPGKAGTVQEVFQAATKIFYNSDGPTGPMVFLGTRYWRELPAPELLRTVLAGSREGDLSHLVHVTDDTDEAVTVLAGFADE
ncbi:LOG family protein [Actinorhabdospora filicis]|nr:LOG family protein [Actinorhabdospora filicis]